MLRFSFPLGRWMGVDVRLHLSFVLLFLAAIAYGEAYGSGMRGLGLFLALAFAVLVRETARAIAAAYAGLRLRAIFLLPVGGVMAFSTPEAQNVSTLPMMLAAPLANFGMALLLLGVSYAAAPGVRLLAQPWVSPLYVLRSFVWMQLVLGIVNLLPASALPTRQVLRANGDSDEGAVGKPAGLGAKGLKFGVVAGFAVALIVLGLVLANLYFVMLGFFCLLGSQLQSQFATNSIAPPESLRVEEVMLTEFTTVSSSDTLQGALTQAVHSLQDVFPVVRGNRLVGSISRPTLTEKLQSEGDSYVQGAMSKQLQVVGPREELLTALRRAGVQGASEFIAVAEGPRLLGILAPQSLSRAVAQVNLARVPLRSNGAGRGQGRGDD